MFENYYVRRILAKFADLLAGFAIASLISAYLGFLGLFFGMAFILFCDGVGHGEGVGKRFFNLKVVRLGGTDEKYRIHWKQSVLRNFPFAIILAVTSVVHVGGVLGLVFGVPYTLFEIYLFTSVQNRQRLGDVLAGTRVVEIAKAST